MKEDLRSYEVQKKEYIKIVPDYVEFVYDSFGISRAEISLTNLTQNWIAFKIRINAAEYYNVNPTQGQISSLDSVIINITSKWNLFKVNSITNIG